MKRVYQEIIARHFSSDRQMLFISGPRQVGKTTSACMALPNALYLNWDREQDRMAILTGQRHLLERFGVAPRAAFIFDEIHKYPHWKDFLKGLFDEPRSRPIPILVTGSARLDVYRRGADSLTGRYFHHRMHPLSVGEIARATLAAAEINAPKSIPAADFAALLRFGGFPEPFLKRNARFHGRWQQTRRDTLFRQDLRDISRIHEIGQVETLAAFLRLQAAQMVNHAALATRIRAAQESVRRWIMTLEDLYYCFLIRPWTTNLARSLLKEPKVYLWDWSVVEDKGARYENMIAGHLLKAVHMWSDQGLGEYALYYLRTKDRREVDFLVARNGKPWFLVEVKASDTTLSPHLYYFHEHLSPLHSFQVVIEADYLEADCFEHRTPVWVPARTFLSQLP